MKIGVRIIRASSSYRNAINEEASNRKVFSLFTVMHVCFIDICFYLEDFNFICCYACFLLNNSYFSLMIFQFCFWFLFILPGYRRRSIQHARFFLFCSYACLFHYYLFLFARF
ncbi:hypothetical protein AAZX31_12G151900 [Glycine max]